IRLWPGVAPRSENWTQPETALGSGDMEHLVNVTTPTLTAYLPDPSTATGTAVIIAPGGGFVFLGMNSEGHDVAKVACGPRHRSPAGSSLRRPDQHGFYETLCESALGTIILRHETSSCSYAADLSAAIER